MNTPTPVAGSRQTTHWEGCWRDSGHHACAVATIERMQAAPVAGYREVTLEDAGTLRDTFLRKRVWPADNLAMNSAMLDCLRSIGAVIRTDGQQAQPE